MLKAAALASQPSEEEGENLLDWALGRLPLRPSRAPRGWKLCPLASVAILESGHTPSRRQPAYWNGEIPWLSLHDSNELDVPEIFTTAQTVSQLGLDNSSARLLPKGTVAFSRTATVGKATVLGRPMATSQDFANYVCGTRLHNRYLMHLFRYMEPEWKRLMAGSTHNTIYMPIFERLQVLLPPIEEQQAIAAALDDIDSLLVALNRLIAKKRAMKRGAMQALLIGAVRLPGFSAPWKVKRLGQLCELAIGRTPSRSVPRYWGRGYPWLSIADLQTKVVVRSKEEITPLAAAQMKIIPRGTLLMSFKLSIGRLAFAGQDLFTNEAICSFTRLDADPEFLYYALQATEFSRYGKQAVKGYTLNSESLRLIEVSLPARAEQEGIAAVLSDLDEEIDALENRRAKTFAIKCGAMQALLTGRKRLPGVEEAAA